MDLSPKISNNLGRRTLAGGSWLFFSRLGQKGIIIIQMTILARLLDPAAFGLMDLGNLAVTSIGMFLFTGFEFALIQKPDLKDDDIHTAWWVMLCRNAMIALALAVLASPISIFFKASEAVPVLLAFAFMQPILGLISASPILLQRNLQFKKIYFIESGSSLLGLIVGVIAALFLRNVWALVFSLLSTHLTYLLLSYIIHPYRPKLMIRQSVIRQFSAYGVWALGSNILWFISSQGASAFAGWMFGVTCLGLYQMAARFASFPSVHLNAIIQAALMPAYSMIQDDRDRLSGAFLRSFGLASMAITGITGLVALGLPPLFILLLGSNWLEAASLILPIALAGGSQSLLRIGTPLFFGTGRPRSQFVLDFSQAITTVLFLWPLGRTFGLKGVPFAMLAGALFSTPIWWTEIRRQTYCSFGDIFKAMMPPGLGLVIMIIVFLIGDYWEIKGIPFICAISWNLMLIAISSLAFLFVIDLGQRFIPNYVPLADLRTFFKSSPL